MKAKLYGFDSSLVHDADPKEGFVIDMVRATDYMVVERERDALQEQVKKLVAENKALTGWIEMDSMTSIDPSAFPATDTAIREIGVKAVSGLLKAYREHVSKAGLSLGNDVTVREAIDALEHCAAQLLAKPEGEQP